MAINDTTLQDKEPRAFAPGSPELSFYGDYLALKVATKLPVESAEVPDALCPPSVGDIPCGSVARSALSPGETATSRNHFTCPSQSSQLEASLCRPVKLCDDTLGVRPPTFLPVSLLPPLPFCQESLEPALGY